MAVRALGYEPDYDVVPHAIIWRPLRYFTVKIRQGLDNLDQFEGASFAIGNDVRFDLRRYKGHPALTVTLYLEFDLEDAVRISQIIDLVVKEMVIPATAVAWRRGQAFEFGKLERHRDDRLREREARNLALKIAAQQPNRAASTRLLKQEIPKYIGLSPEDQKTSQSRPNEKLWQQIVGNVISHREAAESLFIQGYAVKNKTGIAVTPKGIDYLNSIGFLTPFESNLVV